MYVYIRRYTRSSMVSISPITTTLTAIYMYMHMYLVQDEVTCIEFCLLWHWMQYRQMHLVQLWYMVQMRSILGCAKEVVKFTVWKHLPLCVAWQSRAHVHFVNMYRHGSASQQLQYTCTCMLCNLVCLHIILYVHCTCMCVYMYMYIQVCPMTACTCAGQALGWFPFDLEIVLASIYRQRSNVQVQVVKGDPCLVEDM